MGYAQDLVSRGYYGYQGWGDEAAKADFAATGGVGKGAATNTSTAPSSSSVSYPTSFGGDILKGAEAVRQYNVQANQPAIQSLQQSKTPLQDRYTAILDELKSTKTSDVNRTTTASNAELARRGVTGGLAEKTIAENISPLEQNYASKISQLGAAQGADLAEIDKAIAALQAGNPESALSTALNITNLEKSGVQPDTQIVDAGGNQLLINKQTGQVIANLGSSSSGSGGVDASVAALLSSLPYFNSTNNQTFTPSEPKPQTGTPTSKATETTNSILNAIRSGGLG